MGIEIAGYQYKREGYFLIDREFELSEIRLFWNMGIRIFVLNIE